MHLPRIGCLHTPARSRNLELKCEDGGEQYWLWEADGTAVDFSFEKSYYLLNGEIEVLGHGHPLLTRFFVDGDGRPVDVQMKK